MTNHDVIWIAFNRSVSEFSTLAHETQSLREP